MLTATFLDFKAKFNANRSGFRTGIQRFSGVTNAVIIGILDYVALQLIVGILVSRGIRSESD